MTPSDQRVADLKAFLAQLVRPAPLKVLRVALVHPLTVPATNVERKSA